METTGAFSMILHWTDMVSRTSVAHACIWDRVAAAILDLTLLKPGAGEPLNWGDFGSSVRSFTSAGRRPRTEAGFKSICVQYGTVPAVARYPRSIQEIGVRKSEAHQRCG